MIWPFSHRVPSAPTIDAIYGMIVAQARLPEFYEDFGAPDTVNGRFDLIVLHLWLVIRRLRELSADALAQDLFDHFCADMDANLREMGEGDTAVPRKMRKFVEAFYGRSLAYDRSLASGSAEDLADALARNIYGEAGAGANSRRLAAYVIATADALGTSGLAALSAGAPMFPHPARAGDGVFGGAGTGERDG